MAISAADVNTLRKQTGAGIMDCKKALEETQGDFEAAIDFLRKKALRLPPIVKTVTLKKVLCYLKLIRLVI